MNITIVLLTEKRVAILRLDGKIVVGNNGDDKLHEAVVWVLKECKKYNLILDLAGVIALDSSGVGKLFSSYTSARHRGRQMHLLRPREHVLSFLQAHQLDTVFHVFSDEKEAVESFVDV